MSTTKLMFALSLGFGGVIFATQNAFAGAQCSTRDDLITQLADRYGETRRSLGIAANNAVVEMFASDVTGTWTITVSMPDGTMCLVASGQGFQAIIEPLPAKGQKV